VVFEGAYSAAHQRRACPIAQSGDTIASCDAGAGALLLDFEGRYDHGVMRLGDGTAGGRG
jgi:hypothetical protein